MSSVLIWRKKLASLVERKDRSKWRNQLHKWQDAQWVTHCLGRTEGDEGRQQERQHSGQRHPTVGQQVSGQGWLHALHGMLRWMSRGKRQGPRARAALWQQRLGKNGQQGARKRRHGPGLGWRTPRLLIYCTAPPTVQLSKEILGSSGEAPLSNRKEFSPPSGRVAQKSPPSEKDFKGFLQPRRFPGEVLLETELLSTPLWGSLLRDRAPAHPPPAVPVMVLALHMCMCCHCQGTCTFSSTFPFEQQIFE